MSNRLLSRIARTAEFVATLLCIVMFLEVILLLSYFIFI